MGWCLVKETDGAELNWFEDTIRQGVEDEQMSEKRGLMVYFDGSDAVNKKVVSLVPSVEEVDNRLYGVAVCRINGTLTPDELKELKEYCRAQYADGWGEGVSQRPHRTEYGDLYINFWPDSGPFVLTREEMETAKTPIRAPRQPKRGDTR